MEDRTKIKRFIADWCSNSLDDWDIVNFPNEDGAKSYVSQLVSEGKTFVFNVEPFIGLNQIIILKD